MARNFNSRMRKLERITKPKPSGIHTYEAWLDATLKHEEIDYNSTPYLRRYVRIIKERLKEINERKAKTGQN
jgi:hypothetical protein